ncbi:NCS2 family permease [Flavobacterium algicola]|uniref:NCS2 family permease n=1 Tax=Flavobacterium algicola TaxID=556529 RepID=UPI001EFE0357|nr:NCS2 family permease [Flavobacterium algicola]MCG9790861.1 NCS2 family permease [Flavobacterium algicola]
MLEKIFNLKERNTNIKQEAIGGMVTFLTMAYIIFVNPNILSTTGMDKSALITVTCLAAIIGTLIVGFWANVPFAMAPGMGLNAMFAFTLVLKDGATWQQALGVVFLSGVVFIIISVLGLRHKIIDAIPESLRVAIGSGIGLFIAFIGFKQMGLIVANDATLVGLGHFTPALVIGLIAFFVTVMLEHYKVKGSILLGIVLATVLGFIFDPNISLPTNFISTPPSIMPILGQMEVLSVLKISFIAPIFSFLFVNLFDSIGTAMACSMEAGLVDEDGKMPHVKKVLEADAVATMFSGILGTSSTVTYIESAAGIANGARTGLSSVFTAFFFLLAMFFAPLIGTVPAYATAPALILVGIYMAKHLVKIDFSELYLGVPVFLTLLLMPLTYSISSGIAYGFSSYVLLCIFTKNTDKIHPYMWGIGFFSILEIIISQM